MRQVGGIHPVVNLALVESKRTVLRDRSRMALRIVGNDTHTKAAALFACCGFILKIIHCASGFCSPTAVDVVCFWQKPVCALRV